MENKESFEELYKKLYNENINEFKKLKAEYESYQNKQKKKNIKSVKIAYVLFLIMIIVVIACCYLEEEHMMFFYEVNERLKFILLIVLIVYLCKSKKVNKKLPTHIDMFKEKVIFPVIQYIFSESQYSRNLGLSEQEYNIGEWENYCEYKSEDRLVVDINIDERKATNLIMSEVHTKEKTLGFGESSTKFEGLAGYVKLPKDVGFRVRVTSFSLNVDLNYTPEKEIKMDMATFENKFYVETDDRIKTMQILTPDIMSKIIDIVNISKVKFDFCINHDMIHVRFHTGPMFEFDLFKETDQYEKIKHYCNIVSNVKEITEQIYNIVLNTEL